MRTAALFAILFCSADDDAMRERWERFQFGSAGDIVAVTVLENEAQGVTKTETTELLRGFGVPRILHLQGFGAEAGPGTKWILRINSRESFSGSVSTILPDTAEQRRRIQPYLGSPWRRTPIVLLGRLLENPPPAIPGTLYGMARFDVVRILQGNVKEKQVRVPFPGVEYLRPLTAGPDLLVLCVTYYSEEGPAAGIVSVEDLVAVDDATVKEIEKDLQTHNQEAHLAEVRRDQARIREVETAWRFHQAAFVARVGVGPVVQESTNLGGMHFGYYLQEWLRGKFTPEYPGTNGVFVGGGHGYYGPEKKGAGYMAAGKLLGGHPSATIPLGDPRSKQVAEWLTKPLPSFACRPYDPAFFDPAKTPAVSDRLPSADADLFNPALLLDASLPGMEREWLRFRVLHRRAIEAKGRVWQAVHCRIVADGVHRPEWIEKTPGTEWMFVGDELGDLAEGSEWWGRGVLADPGATPPEAPWFQGRLFLGGQLLPATGRKDRELQDGLGALERRNFVRQRRSK